MKWRLIGRTARGLYKLAVIAVIAIGLGDAFGDAVAKVFSLDAGLRSLLGPFWHAMAVLFLIPGVIFTGTLYVFSGLRADVLDVSRDLTCLLQPKQTPSREWWRAYPVEWHGYGARPRRDPTIDEKESAESQDPAPN